MADDSERKSELTIESTGRTDGPLIELWTGSADATRSVGRSLGSLVRQATFIGLTGPLGSGKTCFAQGLGDGLGLTTGMKSPSYIIVAEYPGFLPVYHIDLYRIEHVREVLEFGWEEYLSLGAVLIVEWPERASELLPASIILVGFFHDTPSRRRLRIEARGVEESRIVRDLGRLLRAREYDVGSAESPGRSEASP
jgi:tRNA threonylcarbamoyladenosine biosynthesis protein TsaE